VSRALRAQSRVELALVLRNGEQLLLTLVIPVLVLVFFALADVLPLPEGTDDAVDFLAPGVLALAVLSTSFTSLAIATGFDRHYGVLKRLGATPLGRPRLLAAKTISVLAVMLIQFVVLVGVGLALGWRPDLVPHVVVGAVLLATVAFAGLALLMAGTLAGLTTLAAANGVYVALLLLGDLVVSHEALPGPVAIVAGLLPVAALADLLRAGTAGHHGDLGAWLVVVAWAVVSPLAAARWFRWD
jgi:ABC-2 type transport system permease protein